jgi:hypothetical protein
MLWFCNCAIIVIINRKVLFYELFFLLLLYEIWMFIVILK